MSKNETTETDGKDEISLDGLNKPIPKTAKRQEIEGKTVHINGRSKFRSAPGKYDQKDSVGEDGKVERYTISTSEEFPIEHKDEGLQKISTFYATKVMYDILGRLDDNIDQLFASGKHTPPVVVCKVKGPQRDYWSILSEADYKTSENVVKP